MSGPPPLPKLLQMGLFGMSNFRKKARKPKLRLIIKTLHFFGNQMKYNIYVVSSVEKTFAQSISFHKLINSAEIQRKLIFVLLELSL